jgi:hypothetical protein
VRTSLACAAAEQRRPARIRAEAVAEIRMLFLQSRGNAYPRLY